MKLVEVISSGLIIALTLSLYWFTFLLIRSVIAHKRFTGKIRVPFILIMTSAISIAATLYFFIPHETHTDLNPSSNIIENNVYGFVFGFCVVFTAMFVYHKRR